MANLNKASFRLLARLLYVNVGYRWVVLAQMVEGEEGVNHTQPLDYTPFCGSWRR